MTIRNVVFDIGNVLVRWDSLGIVEAAFGLSGEEARARRHALFGETDIWRALNRGEYTEAGAKAAYIEAGLLGDTEAEALFAALYDSLQVLDQAVRLGLLVTGVTYRHPSVFAAEAMTIDHISNGRLEVSLGAAWFDKEHHELGIPFPPTPERFDLLEDALEIVTRLYTGEVVDYDGKQVSLNQAYLRPLPVQRPHPPIWIGGAGPKRTLPLAARYADVWHSFGTPKSMEEANNRLTELAVEAGRDPASITRAGSLSLDDLDAARKHAGKWRDAGYGYLVCGWPGEGESNVEAFARDVMPEVS